ncbi:MAG TPA: flagellar biosynthesis protein FlhB [Candidatus Acidoferrales bacterium]|nr:flagellar biosynthesis protein FlhB [Candidatus Acidoferrales bacterium]
MAEQSFQEKTEPATPKRRRELKRDGRVAKSIELTTAAVLLIGTVIMYMLGRQFVAQIADIMRDFLSLSHGYDLNEGNLGALAFSLLLRFVLIVGPILLVVMIAGVTTNLLQSGFLLTLKPLRPKGNTFNPANGIKKLGFSQRSMMELTKSIFKLSLVGLFGYFTVRNLLSSSVKLTDSSPSEIFAFMGTSAFSVAMKVSSAFVALAGVDYYFQRRKFEREIRMTKQEVKEEHKQEEGDPAVKGRIRREMIKRHRMRMMQAVPKADVVVTNPTHYAVAIKYDAKEMPAPKVVAKGKDFIAQKIKEIAIENNVPIVEDKPLAQVLYKTVEIDGQIPPDLFRAVAQILAYIYQMKSRSPGNRKPRLRRN